MIYTVTFNPSIDYIVSMENFSLGKTNRTTEEKMFPGGKGMCIGSTDIPMGEAGLIQARDMAKKLPAVTAVFSSPLIRAVQTAQAIGMSVTILDDLREMYAGEWDGLTFEEKALTAEENHNLSAALALTAEYQMVMKSIE